MNKKFWIGGIVGGIIFFLLGWLIYGMLLMNYMNEHSAMSKELHDQVFKPETQFNWAALIASNILSGFLLAAIINWSKTYSLAAGAKIGFVVGLLMCASIDLSFYSMSNMFTVEGMIADIAAGTVITCITGAIVGLVMGKSGSAA